MCEQTELTMSKKRDTDYIQPADLQPSPKKSKTFSKKSASKRIPSFLTQHETEIMAAHNKGAGPADIAALICANNGLSKDAVTGKQISNWINYHKKAKKKKTRPVSLSNNNLRANSSDSCMFDFFRYLVLFLFFLIFSSSY